MVSRLQGVDSRTMPFYNKFLVKEGEIMHYSYRCPKCGVFTIEQSIKDEAIETCPTCNTAIRRIIGRNINVVYRTSGFYCKDNGVCGGESSAKDTGKGMSCGDCPGCQ